LATLEQPAPRIFKEKFTLMAARGEIPSKWAEKSEAAPDFRGK
jgi:hypothetical protein